MSEDEPNAFKGFINDSFVMVGDQLKLIEPQTRELQRAISFAEDNKTDIFDKVFALLKGSVEKKYHVLNHGDCWVNNFLFRYDEQGKAVETKLVDFQCIRHHSVALDLHHLIYSSSSNDLITNGYDQLLKIYHEKFHSILRDNRVDQRVLRELSMDWLKQEMRYYSLFGFIIFSLTLHGVLAEEIIDMDTLSEENIKDFKPQVTQTKNNRMRTVSTHYAKVYL